MGAVLTGPTFHCSDTWQLVINTSTTVVTFLMVFLIQNTQNRDAKALHLKFDELLQVSQGTRNRIVNREGCTDEELQQLQEQFERPRKGEQHKLHQASPECLGDLEGERHELKEDVHEVREDTLNTLPATAPVRRGEAPSVAARLPR